ncbi:unnamed protein product [Thelazia callipaeda]|uniref:Lipid droplet-associated hydrolase n=1 Tax=Thelazia callipaeda TaxID=103827 RepID=A0A0N5CTU3_THECL|nr:unnamed protein product [Thelazia callipaeda]
MIRSSSISYVLNCLDDLYSRHCFKLYFTKLCEWDSVIKSLFFWLSSMPNFVKKYICAWCMKSDEKVPQCILESSAELVDINVIRNIVFMAKDELHTVATLDEALLHHSDRCRFLYGTGDLWCPLHYASEMQRRIGRGLVFIDDKCDHAFVVRHGEAVADKIAAWITEC